MDYGDYDFGQWDYCFRGEFGDEFSDDVNDNNNNPFLQCD